MKTIALLILAALLIAFAYVITGASTSFFLGTIGVHLHWAVCGLVIIPVIVVKAVAK